MVIIDEKAYQKFEQRFPSDMALEEIDAELEKMSAEEAEVYNAVLCNELFLSFCSIF